jgi:hypothetical protein
MPHGLDFVNGNNVQDRVETLYRLASIPRRTGPLAPLAEAADHHFPARAARQAKPPAISP